MEEKPEPPKLHAKRIYVPCLNLILQRTADFSRKFYAKKAHVSDHMDPKFYGNARISLEKKANFIHEMGYL